MNTTEFGQIRVQTCPICGSEKLKTFLEISDVPAQDGVVYDSAEAARVAPTGDIRLAMCGDCCYIGNLAFDAEKVGFAEYRYSQHHSPKYQKHVGDVVAKLAETYGVSDKAVIDIGCGDGYFLRKICDAGKNRGVGIDPSATLREEQDDGDGRLRMIRDYYSEKYAHHRGDLVSCRHVIDELPAPKEFLAMIMGSLADRPDSILYLEVPNAMLTLERKLVWNIGYAKRSWFTPASIQAMFGLCGLTVLEIEELFDGEYLGVTGRRASVGEGLVTSSEVSAGKLVAAINEIDHHLKMEVQRWAQRVLEIRECGEKTAIWGAGMRCINFLSRYGGDSVFRKVVDINPERQGVYLPGSGSYVEHPQTLRAFRPDRIILSNPGYKDEIQLQLLEMGVDCETEDL